MDKNFEKFFDLTIEEQEMLLATWIVVSFTCSTTGILFFKLANDKTNSVNKNYASIICVVLIVVALLYNIYSLYVYWDRTNIILSYAKDDTESKNKINVSRLVYTIISSIICLTQIFIIRLLARSIVNDNKIKYLF